MQHTIATVMSGKGVGSGHAIIHFSINPAPANTGIRVLRTDISPVEIFNSNKVLESSEWLNTREFNLLSIKPLIAVLRIFGIDNSIIEVNGNELPNMNNCAELYVFLVRSSGKRQQHVPRKNIKLLQPIVVSDRGKWIRLLPSSRFRIACMNSSFQKTFPAYNFGTMVEFSKTLFVTEICRARRMSEIKKQWDLLGSENLPELTLKNKKQKLINEINDREIFQSVGDIAILGINWCIDYVSFNADDELRKKLIINLIDNASLYFSKHCDDEVDFQQNEIFSEPKTLVSAC